MRTRSSSPANSASCSIRTAWTPNRSRDANSKSEKGQDHAWFSAFAPVKDPEVVVVVFVERGGHGGTAAAPIAKQIFSTIFLEKVAFAAFGG